MQTDHVSFSSISWLRPFHWSGQCWPWVWDLKSSKWDLRSWGWLMLVAFAAGCSHPPSVPSSSWQSDWKVQKRSWLLQIEIHRVTKGPLSFFHLYLSMILKAEGWKSDRKQNGESFCPWKQFPKSSLVPKWVYEFWKAENIKMEILSHKVWLEERKNILGRL